MKQKEEGSLNRHSLDSLSGGGFSRLEKDVSERFFARYFQREGETIEMTKQRFMKD